MILQTWYSKGLWRLLITISFIKIVLSEPTDLILKGIMTYRFQRIGRTYLLFWNLQTWYSKGLWPMSGASPLRRTCAAEPTDLILKGIMTMCVKLDFAYIPLMNLQTWYSKGLWHLLTSPSPTRDTHLNLQTWYSKGLWRSALLPSLFPALLSWNLQTWYSKGLWHRMNTKYLLSHK